MPANAVTIDASWITTAATAPYILNAPNTVYTLTTDVDVVQTGFYGEPFKLVGNEIVLNLNGHSVRVNGERCPQITDSMLYRRTSEYTVRVNNANESIMFGGKHGTGIGLVGQVVDNIPPADQPVINSWSRTK